MKPRKYTDIRVLSEVYVSSTSDYEFHCVCNLGRFNYVPDLQEATYKGKRDYVVWTPPQYVRKEVERQIVELHKAGKFKFYEHRQDGSKRYEPLRYHDPDFFAKWLEGWGSHE